jgi:hypothetical protein
VHKFENGEKMNGDGGRPNVGIDSFNEEIGPNQ